MSKKSPVFKICNLCLSADKPTEEIFGLGLTGTVLFVCGVEIEKNGFSPVVCEDCVNKLEKFRLFKTTAQESYKSLQDFHYNLVDPTEDLSADNKFGLLEIQVLESSDELQQQAHIKLEIEEDIYQFTDSNAKTLESYEKRDQVTDAELSTEWHCHHCEISLGSQQKLRNHFRQQHSLRQNYCKDCHELFLSKKDFEIHGLKIHGTLMQEVDNVDSDTRHLVSVSETPPIVNQTSEVTKKRDPLSLKKTISRQTVKQNKLKPETTKKYTTKASTRTEPRSIFAGNQCEICDKIFVTKKCLNQHLREHTTIT